jgi:hypothetical protein
VSARREELGRWIVAAVVWVVVVSSFVKDGQWLWAFVAAAAMSGVAYAAIRFSRRPEVRR